MARTEMKVTPTCGKCVKFNTRDDYGRSIGRTHERDKQKGIEVIFYGHCEETYTLRKGNDSCTRPLEYFRIKPKLVARNT